MDQLAMASYEVCIDIGGMPILVHTDSAEFAHLLENRYGSFVVREAPPADPLSEGIAPGDHDGRPGRSGRAQDPRRVLALEVELVAPGIVSDAEELRVRLERGRWVMERGDFRAEWDPQHRRGWVHQSPNPYSIDSVLRILHSIVLAREGGFLVHAASAVRNGRAFLFAGVSGAGKTTISRLAPPDVVLLTDEISYVRPRKQRTGNRRQTTGNSSALGLGDEGQRTLPSLSPVPSSLFPSYEAYGTPFTGELARIGENLRAPIAALYLLTQGAGNRVEALTQAEAARALLKNILFFAQDEELVRLVFHSASDFVSRVPVRRMVFAQDARIWELIT